MRIPIPWRSRSPKLPATAANTAHSADEYRAVPGPAEMTRAANVASIAAIPLTILPDGPARTLLIAEAAAGRDVYAYQPSPRDPGRWNIWYGPLADSDRPRHNGRIPVEQWAANWDMILVGMARSSDGTARNVTQPNAGGTAPRYISGRGA